MLLSHRRCARIEISNKCISFDSHGNTLHKHGIIETNSLYMSILDCLFQFQITKWFILLKIPHRKTGYNMEHVRGISFQCFLHVYNGFFSHFFFNNCLFEYLFLTLLSIFLFSLRINNMLKIAVHSSFGQRQRNKTVTPVPPYNQAVQRILELKNCACKDERQRWITCPRWLLFVRNDFVLKQ